MTALFVLAVLSLLIWLCILCHPHRPYLPYTDAKQSAPEQPPLSPQPLVSVVIPARNEEKTIAAALTSHFQSTWKHLEVICVDDKSADRTAEEAGEAARSAPLPFVLVSSSELPRGWTGKVHAMHQGVERARGKYILFCDADIVFAPEVVEELVRESEAKQLSLNSRMALLSCFSLIEKLLVPAFVYFFCLLYPFRGVSRKKSQTAAAAGGCMLVHRKDLDRAGGLQRIQDAIIDDVSLARLLKRSDGSIRLQLTKKVTSIRRYRRLKDFWDTVTRTAFSELRYSRLLLGAVTCIMGIAFFIPPAASAAGAFAGHAGLLAAGGAAYLLQVLLYSFFIRFYGVSFFYAFLLPVTALLYLAMTWHSALRYLAGRRSSWKGRDYS